MKKLFYLLVIIGLAIISCNKPDVLPTEIEVSFQASMGGTNLKAGGDPIPAFDCNTDVATHATLVINDDINLTFTVELIRDDNGAVYTESIKLPVLADGETYELTSFILYNGDPDNGGIEILATPYANAPFGAFVTSGLPLDIDIEGFYKIDIPIQVLCYTPTTIIDFGYSWFSFEKITVRELCFFGDICVDDVTPYDNDEALYRDQLYGLRHDMPAIFEIEVSIWDTNQNDWKEISIKNNEKYDDGSDWLGEGAALCVQYPDYEGIVDAYKIELSVLYFDGTSVVYVPFRTWVFDENDGFLEADQEGDGVIDFVIGDCVPDADIIIDPNDPTPDPGILVSEETAFAYDPNGYATCFSDVSPILVDGAEVSIGSNNWGWSNGKYSQSTDTHTLNLYAGVGGCNLYAGTKVGHMTLSYSNNEVSVVYYADAGVEFGDVHLYIGTTAFDVTNASMAPGQFPYTQDDVNGDTYTFDITDIFSGPIYIIAHAEVSPTS